MASTEESNRDARKEDDNEKGKEKEKEKEEEKVDQAKEAKKRKGMKPRSEAWKSFTKLEEEDGTKARYEDEDPFFLLEMVGEKAPGTLEKEDWENANKLVQFLENFKSLTERVSATQHVTAHTLFHEIGDVKISLQEWCDSEDEMQKAMGERMLAKYNKYWGKPEEMNLFIFIAVVLDPRYKLSDYTKGIFLEMFGDSKGNEFWSTLVQSFRLLFEEYRNLYAPSDKEPQLNDSQEVALRATGKMKSRVAKKMRMENGQLGTSRSDLDKYLGEENEPDTADFDILDWWKKSSHRLPILSIMARDVLAIPVSTVASE